MMETPKTIPRQNTSYSSSFSQNNSTIDFLTDDSHSIYSEKSHRSLLIDDVPVPSPKKDFSALLEEKLKDSDAVMTENKSKTIVKKPFLKKGQGLARFMPNAASKKTPKQSPRARSASFSSTQSKPVKPIKQTNLTRCNSIPKSIKRDPKKSVSPVPPVAQTKLTLKHVPLPQKKILSKSPTVNIVSEPKIKFKDKAVDVVADQSSSDFEGKTKKEMEEVRIFELLEDKANNSSFCSTSSTVIAFLQQSTPLKHKALLHSATKHQISFNNIGDQTLEDIVTSTETNHLSLPKSQYDFKDYNSFQWETVPFQKFLKKDKMGNAAILPYGTDVDVLYDQNSNKESHQNDNNVSLHVRFAEHNEYNEYKTTSDTSSVSSESETILDFQNKGVWSDNSATPDSSDAESIMSEPKSNLAHDVNGTSINLKKKDPTDSEYDDTDNESQNIYNIADSRSNKEGSDVEYENEVESKNDTINSEDTVIEKDDDKSFFKSELLKKRLVELEHEIEIFQKESATLQNLKQKLQEERTNLHEERIKMQRSLKEKESALEVEKKKTESILLEEKKRLAREKAALESRMKDAYEKAQKSKQERQEIQSLREELEELKDEFMQKESKWSAASARQRSQIRVLQAENSKLKQELEQMQQKQRARLKRASCPPNTRAIHQISKFLADRKKISPSRYDQLVHEERKKKPANVDVNHVEEEELVEEKPAEKEPRKVKIPKSMESIARTRDLYQQLLNDATVDVRDGQMSNRSLLNRTIEIQENNLNDDDYGGEAPADHEDLPDEAGALRLESPEREEMHQLDNAEIDPSRINENKQGIKEIHHPDGHVEYWYPNGNVKKVFPDKGITKTIYYNGDVRETDKSGTVRYFYAATRTWHTSMPDGLEILEFPDGQVERRSKDGTVEVAFSDGSVRIMQADGSEKWALRDGTIAETSVDGEKILTLPNGQREIHTKDHKRREYPDGTVKIVYPDGVQETRYANGRVRLKDKDGNLLMDTYQ